MPSNANFPRLLESARKDLAGFRWVSDRYTFNKSDYWASRPFTPGKQWTGDCDDYACTAANHLHHEYGIREAQLHLVYCAMERNGEPDKLHGNHLVLWVTDKPQLKTAKVRVFDCNSKRRLYHPAEQYRAIPGQDMRWISYHTLSWSRKSDWRKLRNLPK